MICTVVGRCASKPLQCATTVTCTSNREEVQRNRRNASFELLRRTSCAAQLWVEPVARTADEREQVSTASERAQTDKPTARPRSNVKVCGRPTCACQRIGAVARRAAKRKATQL